MRPAWVDNYVANTYEALIDRGAAILDSCLDVRVTAYRQNSELCSHVVQTSDTSIDIYWYSNETSYAAQATIDVFQSGSLVQKITPASFSSLQKTTVSGLTPNTPITITLGAQRYDGVTVYGTHLIRVQSTNGLGLVGGSGAAAPSRRLVCWDDSIGSGYVTGDTPQLGMFSLCRATYPGRVSFVGWGSESLRQRYVDGSNSITPLANAIIAGCDGTAQNDIWLQDSYNDYYGTDGSGFASWTAAGAFTTHATELLTALLASGVPGLHIWWAPTRVSSVSGANGNGDTLAAFATAIHSIITSINDLRLVFVDTTAVGWYDSGNLADFVHPNAAGHVKAATMIRATIGW